MSSAQLNTSGPQDMVRGRAPVGRRYEAARHAARPAAIEPPWPMAALPALNAQKAEALPGVKAVVTAADCAGAVDYLLAGEKVLHHGQVVAAVAASDPGIAAKALELIDITYEEKPGVLSLEDALAKDAPLVHEDQPGNIAQQDQTISGDCQAGFASAKLVLHECFSIPSLSAARPEPTACLAQPGQGGITLWTNTTNAADTGPQLARALGLPKQEVLIKRPYRQKAPAGVQELCAAELCAALLAQKMRPSGAPGAEPRRGNLPGAMFGRRTGSLQAGL